MNAMQNTIKNILIFGLALLLAACNTTTVRTTQTEAAVVSNAPIPEELLLDVGIDIFDPNIQENAEAQEYRKILEAEARFMPYKLMETVQSTGNWGAVRVIPEKQSEMDVWVDGKILKSDGATLELEITVSDTSKKKWYTKRYKDEASKYAYENALTKGIEPFQNLYNKIANDMLQYYLRLEASEIKNLRTISQLQFAKRFSPDAFGQHIEEVDGRYVVKRLPADNDPILQRVNAIRERDYLFVDTLQDYYGNFVLQMEEPYREWRRAYYEEGEALRKVQNQSNARLVGGVLAVLAGIVAQGSDSAIARAAGQVAIVAGGTGVVSGINKREEAKIHIEALKEISESLDAEIEPHTMQLEERSVTLTGSVNEQYAQWQALLKEMYKNETGL